MNKELGFEERYLTRFNSFFKTVDLSSTYKPVFLKSIMDLSEFEENSKLIGKQWLEKIDSKLKVELDFVAARYTKYFWDMYHKFKLRQSHNPSDVNIHQFFNESKEQKPPTLEDLASEKYSKLRKKIIQRSIKPQVLKYLNSDLNLYQIIPRQNNIMFDYEIVPFFRKYRGILIPAINYILTRYLEKINFSPRIAEKVLGKIPRDYLTAKEEKILMRLHDSCFYCGKTSEKYHIDHVIPFDYVFHTDIFNTVPACANCNSKKSNILPTQKIFKRILERNQKLLTQKEYSKEWYQNLYDKCVIEYQGNRPYFSP